MSWAQISIGDIGRVVTGDTPPKKNQALYGDAYPFIKPTDMTVGQRVTTDYEDGYSQEGYEKYRKKLIPAGSTAVVTIGSIGQKLTWLHTDCFVNQAVNAVIPDDEKFNKLYVYYLLKHNLGLVKQADTGASSGRENVSKSNFSALKVWACLDKDQQARIAEVLDGMDSLLEVNQRRIQLLEDAARRLYREWFVHLRYPSHELVTVKDGVPQGWTSQTMNDVCDAVGGGTPSTERSEYWDGDVVWVTPTDVTRNDCLVMLDSAKKITEAGLANSSAKLVPAEAILMTSRASIGFFALMDQHVCTNQGFISVIPKQDNTRMYLLFNMMGRVEEMITLATGSTFKELSKKTFRSLPINWPTPDILQAFEDTVYPMLQQTRHIKKQSEQLKRARDLLLPKLMSGQLDVSGINLPDEVVA
jgi:type I restriction enzyme S subunit